MANISKCNKFYYSDESPNFLVYYKLGFKEEIDKTDYACGDIITERIAIISVPYKDLDRLISEVKSIAFVEPRSTYVLQDISPNDVDEIYSIKDNTYLNLSGKGVLVGLVDTGIDYLNKEFIREDGVTRIRSIWDQTIENGRDKSVYLGDTFTSDEINRAIDLSKNNGDPYSIVPSKDTVGHGTQIASIIGSRGYNPRIKGIASDCEFVVVKLLESLNFKKVLRENGLEDKNLYNSAEVLAAVDYLKNYALKAKMPMVICIGVGTTEGSHDGESILSRYITVIGRNRGIVSVCGTGNQGAAQGHASGYIKSVGEMKTIELKIPRFIANLIFYIWIKRPNRMAINIISPDGGKSNFIPSNRKNKEEIKFALSNTVLSVNHFIPEHFTGHQAIEVGFRNLVPGIWRIQLRGEYIVDGRYDIWLPPKEVLPEGTNFLEPDPDITLTIPSTARKVVTVAYYNNERNLGISESGRGFNSNGLINPDIITAGINILTTKPSGEVGTFSGSSAATTICAGVCCLLLQWGVVEKNNLMMYSATVRSYLMYGAQRRREFTYPSREVGYGMLDILGTFKFISGLYENLARNTKDNISDYSEYYIGPIFVRIPNELRN